VPHWTHDLPAESKKIAFSLRRTPPDRPLKALVTTENLLVCTTHWWTGRTVPCEADECEACKAGAPGRTHAYIAALEHGTREHFIFECTAKAAAPFALWLEAYPTLRGCYFLALRPKRRRNAAVEITCKPFDLSTVTLPPPPDIPAAMALIWQLPGTSICIAQPGDEVEEITTRNRVIDQMRFNPADGKPKTTSRRSNGAAQ